MGKRDYWPYDRNYFKNWSEHNKDYWKKWAEYNKGYWKNWSDHNKGYWKNWSDHNKGYWKNWAEHNKSFLNKPQIHQYARHCGRGRMLGKIISFGLGFWAGSFVNQRYRMPSANPREIWVEMRTASENSTKDQPSSQESSELRDIIDKVKQLEKRYRKPQASDESKPSTPDSSEPKSSE